MDEGQENNATTLCRDCHWSDEVHAPDRCPRCGGRRIVAANGLLSLPIAHLDCDAFYASVEKRDDPSLRTKPLIVGGGRRGVVTTACYIARSYGVRSAMPMFKAMALCPSAEIRKPRMDAYVDASKRIRAMFEALTPLVEPLSLDEAFLDMTGTAQLHKAPAAILLNQLTQDVEREIGVSISVGLAPNKFLAKLASDLDKPRGFAVITEDEAPSKLATMPVTAIWGVGPATAAKLERDGLRLIQDVQNLSRDDLVRRFGGFGLRLHNLAFGRDMRAIEPNAPRKSVSAETTFDADTNDSRVLDARLWRLCEKVSSQLKARDLAASAITIKLKTSDFRLMTRRTTLPERSSLADTIHQLASPLVSNVLLDAPQTRYRLIGLAAGDLSSGVRLHATAVDFFDTHRAGRAETERTIDQIRTRFGGNAIWKGRSIED